MNQISRLLKIVVCLFVLTAVTFAVFQYTAHIRKPWFGVLSLKNHHVLTGDTLKFSQYWYREGPLALKFGMLVNPPSVEFPTLESREPYVSYPPGAIIPIYLISKAAGHEPSPDIVMGYNLTNHFFLSLFLAWIAFFFCVFGGLPLWASLIFGFVPVIISQLMPSPLYFFQNVYWGDQAVLMPMTAFILLELLRENTADGRRSRLIIAAQALLMIWGSMTDWFFVVFALVVFLRRMFQGEYRGGVKSFLSGAMGFWTPVGMVIGLFLLQVMALNGIPLLIQRYQERTGQAAGAGVDNASFIRTFWDGHAAQGFGPWTGWCLWGILWLLLIMGAFLLVRRRFFKEDVPAAAISGFSLAMLLLSACFLQLYLFRNHSAVHNFSALKLVLPLSLIPFVILPVMAGSFYKGKLIEKGCWVWTASACVLMALTVTLMVHPGYRAFFSDKNPVFEQLGGFIARNTGPRDVVFSTQGAIDENPLFLAYSRKRVYLVQNTRQIYMFIQRLKGPYTINILTTAHPETDEGIRKLMAMAYDVRREGFLALYKIKGQ